MLTRKNPLVLFVLPTMLLLFACPGDNGEQPTPTPPPSQCNNIDASANFEFEVDVCWFGTMYTYADLEDLARDVATPGEPSSSIALPGLVTEIVALTRGHEMVINLAVPKDEDIAQPPDRSECVDDTRAWMVFRYLLPLGLAMPMNPGDETLLSMVFRFVDGDLYRVARSLLLHDLVDGQPGPLRFYSEPGANGIALGNDPINPFQSVRQLALGCDPIRRDPCGNLVNTAIEFRPTTGATFSLWPGEQHEFLLETEVLTAVNIWSFTWEELVCTAQGFEPSMAFIVLAGAD